MPDTQNREQKWQSMTRIQRAHLRTQAPRCHRLSLENGSSQRRPCAATPAVLLRGGIQAQPRASDLGSGGRVRASERIQPRLFLPAPQGAQPGQAQPRRAPTPRPAEPPPPPRTARAAPRRPAPWVPCPAAHSPPAGDNPASEARAPPGIRGLRLRDSDVGPAPGRDSLRVTPSEDWLSGAAVVADWVTPDWGVHGGGDGCAAVAALGVRPRIGYGVWTEGASGCEDGREPGRDRQGEVPGSGRDPRGEASLGKRGRWGGDVGTAGDWV